MAFLSILCLFAFFTMPVSSSAQGKLYVENFGSTTDINAGTQTGARYIHGIKDNPVCAFIIVHAPEGTKIKQYSDVDSISEGDGAIYVWVLAHDRSHPDHRKSDCCFASSKKLYMECPGYGELEVTYADYLVDEDFIYEGEFLIGNVAYDLSISSVPDLFSEALEQWDNMDFENSKKFFEKALEDTTLDGNRRFQMERKLNLLLAQDKGQTNLKRWERMRDGAWNCYERYTQLGKAGAPKDTLINYLDKAMEWYALLWNKSKATLAKKMYEECANQKMIVRNIFRISGVIKQSDKVGYGFVKNPKSLANVEVTLLLGYHDAEAVRKISTGDAGKFEIEFTSEVEPDYIVIKRGKYTSEKIKLKKSTDKKDRSWKDIEVVLTPRK